MTNSHSTPAAAVPPSISQNIETIEQFYQREAERIGPVQRLFERIGNGMGRPLSLIGSLLFVALWILISLSAGQLGLRSFDPPPFAALQGLVSLAALVTTLIVLIGQNRLAKLEQRREHLELQVNILTEQKTTKLIHLLEELRHDLPGVRDRDDPDAAALQRPTDTKQILNALENTRSEQPRGGKEPP